MGKKLTKQEVQQRLNETFQQEVQLIGEYINRRTPIHLKCNNCNYEWEALPATVLYDNYTHQCPNCSSKLGKKVKCAYCGKEIYRQPSQLERSKSGLFYCSYECGNRHKNEIRKQSGIWDNSLHYRSRAFDAYPHKCAVCNWDEDERILEVHHIDENREHNNVENLCILCPTCHRKITLGYYKLTTDFKLELNT